jgi:hypothetical protein
MNEPSHTSEHFSGPFKRPLTRRLNTEIPLCSAAPLSTRIADPRRDIPLLFQPIEGGVDGAERHIMAGPLRDFSPDRYAIGVLAESGHREEDDLLEAAQPIVAFHQRLHFFYKTEES